MTEVPDMKKRRKMRPYPRFGGVNRQKIEPLPCANLYFLSSVNICLLHMSTMLYAILRILPSVICMFFELNIAKMASALYNIKHSRQGDSVMDNKSIITERIK